MSVGERRMTMPKRKPARRWPPKGAYPLPGGGYAQDQDHINKDGQQIHLRYHLKAEPDLERLARVLLKLAKEQSRRDKS